MSNSSYVPIDIPDLGEDGLSDIQRDDLARSSARSLNFFGKKIDEHDKEIYGEKDYKGMKAKSHESPCQAQEKTQEQVEKNTKKIWYILGILAASGLTIAGSSPLWIGGM